MESTADAILTLINSKPSSPTKEEIQALLPRPVQAMMTAMTKEEIRSRWFPKLTFKLDELTDTLVVSGFADWDESSESSFAFCVTSKGMEEGGPKTWRDMVAGIKALEDAIWQAMHCEHRDWKRYDVGGRIHGDWAKCGHCQFTRKETIK